VKPAPLLLLLQPDSRALSHW